MAIQWILVAQRAGAKLFRSAPSGIRLQLLKEFSHPEGRLKNRELAADRPGMESESTPHEHQAEAFAQELAQWMDKARGERDYDQLVLVAEPRFLGRLQSALNPRTANTIVRTIEKELTKMSRPALEKRLSELIAV